MTQTVAIIGAGLIGQSWAIVFARAGWRVQAYDPADSARGAAMTGIEAGLRELRQHGLFDGDIAAALANVSVYDNLSAALAGAEYIQENGPEVLEAKQVLFSQLDEAAEPTAIIGSSSSGLRISASAGHCAGRERCVVAHPVNPPHLVPCVELSPADFTRADVTEKAYEIMRSIGQSPMRIKKEIDAFIVNRLQGALLNEALRLAQAGDADPEDIDICVRDGLGLRWSFMGPFETIDLNAAGGLGDYAARFGGIYTAMAPQQGAAPDWSGPALEAIESARRKQLPEAQLTARSQWRNRRLVALAAHRKSVSENDA